MTTNRVDLYFREKLGAGWGEYNEPNFRVTTTCGKDCVRAIDSAAALIKVLREAHGSNAAETEEMIVNTARDICHVFYYG